MGPRLGKFVYYSYNMSDRQEKKNDKHHCEISSVSCSSSSEGRVCTNNDKSRNNNNCPQENDGKDSDDKSDGTSSGGGETTSCVNSWRTRSENWSKKKRTFKNGSSNKKEFFKRNKKWPMRKSKGESDVEPPPTGSLSCVCTMYRRTNSESNDPTPGPSSSVASNNNDDTIQRLFATTNASNAVNVTVKSNHAVHTHTPIIDLARFNPELYPIDDEDERMRQERAKEMSEGVELSVLLGEVSIRNDCYPAHSQVDFIHYLVPDLKQITNCSFYWGKIDRYEAEKLLESKPEGTFLLRDSAQEEYLFSVSFRRYNRSLHARIEQWNNQFSFDSHDPSVYSSPTVTGLIEHYKDPSCCMFFEPMLTTPLHRNFPFGLQHLARATISSHLKYDSINVLNLPKPMKMYLKEYHYKQRVRVRRLE